MDVVDEDDLNLDALKCFLEDQNNRLHQDKLLFVKRKEQNVSEDNYGVRFDKSTNSNVSEKMSKTNNAIASSMVKNTSGKLPVDSRELEKEKLINSLSIPRSRHSCPTFRNIKPSPGIPSTRASVIDFREKEKDRLAAIFAASNPCYLSKVSNRHCKNGRRNFSKNQQGTLNKPTNDIINTLETEEHLEVVDKQKSDIPEILVSEYKEESRTRDSINTENPEMVRIGEFSPLNPNNHGRRPSLGIGEYGEERRRLMLDQRKQEYNEYLQQAQKESRNPTPPRVDSPHSRSRTVATQTVWSDDVSHAEEEKELSPKLFSKATLFSDRDLQCKSPTCRISPVTNNCYDDVDEKEIKELLYREELKRQIEEKNRLKQQMKKREEEEEARIEAKIQRDLEKMRRQYEEERLQRFELAIRRKEQEDFLRQRLADEHVKALEESKMRRKQCLRDKSVSPNDKACQKSSRSLCSSRNIHLNESLPISRASNALSEVHEIFRQPLLEVPNHSLPIERKLSPPERDVPLKKKSALNVSTNTKTNYMSRPTPSPTMQSISNANITSQRGVDNPNMKTDDFRKQTEFNSLPESSQEAAKKLKEVEELLRAPLISQPDRILLPISPPLVDLTIPPYVPTLHTHRPVSPPLPASKRAQRTNCEVLEDKWKVPDTKSDKVSEDVLTSHNRSVLTQLGVFRRHLQQERLRMQQRVRDDSP